MHYLMEVGDDTATRIFVSVLFIKKIIQLTAHSSVYFKIQWNKFLFQCIRLHLANNIDNLVVSSGKIFCQSFKISPTTKQNKFSILGKLYISLGMVLGYF